MFGLIGLLFHQFRRSRMVLALSLTCSHTISLHKHSISLPIFHLIHSSFFYRLTAVTCKMSSLLSLKQAHVYLHRDQKHLVHNPVCQKTIISVWPCLSEKLISWWQNNLRPGSALSENDQLITKQSHQVPHYLGNKTDFSNCSLLIYKKNLKADKNTYFKQTIQNVHKLSE